MKSTRANVAKLAGVSEGTVSYVLNNSRYVSDEIRAKVMKAVEELNYQPDAIARAMVKKESFQISVILDDIANPMFAKLVAEIEKTAIRNNYMVNICGGYMDFKSYVNNIIARRIDAVYICVCLEKIHVEDIERLLSCGVKVVMGGDLGSFAGRISQINDDMKSGVDMMVKHLVDLGHKDIVYLSAFPKSYTYDQRYNYFSNSIKQYLPDRVAKIITSEEKILHTTVETGYSLCKAAHILYPETTAIMCTNDLMAFGAMKYLNEKGYKIPDDISVAGIDNTELSSIIVPSLTTFGPNVVHFGKTVFQVMSEAIKTDKVSDVIIPVYLHKRQSTGPCKTCANK